MPRRSPTAPILVLDTASPVVSVALGDAKSLLAERRLELRRSSEKLLDAVDEVLADAGLPLEDVRGVAALRGPGSFTGLRVGLGTAIGWHQALDLPATGLDGHEVLALAASRRLGDRAEGRQVTAAVDALRGAWCVRSYRLGGGRPEPLDERRLLESAELADELRSLRRAVVGFGVAALGLREQGDDLEIMAAPPLAPVALALSETLDWDPGLLVQPIYFREPAVSQSKKDPAPPSVPAASAGVR